jgi:LysM repeat protein
MSRLTPILELVKSNLYPALAVAVIVMIASGYLFFYTSTIGPGLIKRDALVTQVAAAQQSLVDSGNLAQSPSELQAKLASAQATLTASQSMFLSEAQASRITDALYQYASASRVTITDLQTQPVAKQSSQNSLNITTIRLQAQGDSKQLVEFISRIKEAALKGFLIDNLSLSQDKTAGADLAMQVTLYSSLLALDDPPPAKQAASSDPPAAAPPPRASASQPQLAVPVAVSTSTPVPLPPTLTPMPTATALPPTPIPPTPVPPTPAPQFTVYGVRPGDTLFSLARRYGTTIQAIMAANHLSSYQIFIGQQLIIPTH